MASSLVGAALADSDLAELLAPGLADEVEAWLADPSRTAHRLVSATTADLVAQALAGQPTAASSSGPVLPSGLWRVLPDRLLALHPARRGEVTARRRISTAGHLELTAQVLEQWGWARTGHRRRGITGRRCILGAQYAVCRLGYGDDATVHEAGRQIQGALAVRGITLPYPAWNELPTTTGRQALDLVRSAAKGAL